MKVSIKSDGTVQGTRLMDSDTGRPVDFVSGIVWQIDHSGAGLVLRVADPAKGRMEIDMDALVEVDGHYLGRLVNIERAALALAAAINTNSDPVEDLPPSIAVPLGVLCRMGLTA